MPAFDPASVVVANPEVPEERRFCWRPGCRATVGRRGNRSGYCTRCGAAFSFEPALHVGDVVAGKYDVAGLLAYGGQGWIYLARDRDVAGLWVVLKGVVQQDDQEAVATAVAERQFLARVRHPNVVRIYTATEHAGAGYIVMEYVGGRTLRAILDEAGHPLPVEQAIAYVLGILPAFAYLHDQGLLYADFKPENAMVQEKEIKLLDLGAVKRLDDQGSVILGTPGYQAPEVERHGLSVVSDLYTIARTLSELVLGQTDPEARLPARQQAVLDRHESLHRFLLKGTAAQPSDRFQSADEMAEQLLGVLRVVVAVERGEARPAVSTLFGRDLHAQLGGGSPDWRHLPGVAVDRDDPAAGIVGAAAGLDPDRQLAFLEEAVREGQVPETPELRLRRARALIELGRYQEAEGLLAEERQRNAWDWRVAWYRSLSLLARWKADEAREGFDQVHFDLPGELAPKLAEAMAAELAEDLARAAALYAVVTTADPGFTSAAVGLARVRQRQGDRSGAVAAYDLVPSISSAYQAAQVSKAEALIQRGEETDPTGDQLAEASAVIERLALDARERARLARELLDAALALVMAGKVPADGDARLLGHPLREKEVRLGLEQAYRDLARHATGAERAGLIDLANQIRPVTLR